MSATSVRLVRLASSLLLFLGVVGGLLVFPAAAKPAEAVSCTRHQYALIQWKSNKSFKRYVAPINIYCQTAAYSRVSGGLWINGVYQAGCTGPEVKFGANASGCSMYSHWYAKDAKNKAEFIINAETRPNTSSPWTIRNTWYYGPASW